MCSREATSKEHIPPKAIFPKAKDLPPDASPIQNLITVPSCDVHNTQKSGDDEYVIYAIIAYFENNSKTLPPLISKMARAGVRKSKAIRKLKDGSLPVSLDGRPTIAIDVDLTKFNKSIEQMARGLYFYEYKLHWLDAFRFFYPAFSFITERNAAEANQLQQELADHLRSELSSDFQGENPDYFKYQLHRYTEDSKFSIIVRLVFYEGMELYVMSKEGWTQDDVDNMNV